MIEGSRSGSITLTNGSESVTLINGSGSGFRRPRNIRILWIRIRNTVSKFSLSCIGCLYESCNCKLSPSCTPPPPPPNIFSQMTWPQIAEPCMQLLILPSLETHFLAPGLRHSCTSIILSSFLSASSFFPPCFYFPEVCKNREGKSTVFDEILNRRCCMLQLVIDKAYQKTSYSNSEDVAHFQVQ